MNVPLIRNTRPEELDLEEPAWQCQWCCTYYKDTIEKTRFQREIICKRCFISAIEDEVKMQANWDKRINKNKKEG